MSKKEQILQEAEIRVREGGYNNVSFRDLATAVGIKSASVHYHFPTKEDLGAALAERYTENFLLQLGSPQALLDQGQDPIDSYVNQFQHALKVDKKMCLCGMLGAEAQGLPAKVKAQTQQFFVKNMDWLSHAYSVKEQLSEEASKLKAATVLCTLEGALLVSLSLEDVSLFDAVAERL